MGTRFVANRAVAGKVAVMVAPDVGDIAERVAEAAKRFAPPQKTWKTIGDALVRKEHRKANNQAIPGNLRYVIDSPKYDREHYGVGAQQLLREPRDPNGSPGITINCRCRSQIDPDGVSRTISAGPPVVTGAQVQAKVKCTHKRAHEAEFGNDVDEGAHFMSRAIDAVSVELR